MKRIAVIGRFQPFHWGHFEYLLEASALGDELVVGIAHPYASSVYVHRSNVDRSLPSANPFSFKERVEMIQRTLDRLAPQITARLRPCTLGPAKVLRQSLGHADLVAITVYDEWGEHKVELVRRAGYKVAVLWTREEKITTSTQIRDRLLSGGPWEHLVPRGSARVIRRVASHALARAQGRPARQGLLDGQILSNNTNGKARES